MGIITVIKQAQISHLEKEMESGKSFKEQGTSIFLSVMCSLSISVINYSLKLIVRRFSLSENHETLTKMNVSVAIKLTIARFLNSSVILVIVNTEPKNWFKGGNLAYDAIILILLMAVQHPVLLFSNYFAYYKRWKIAKQEALGKDCKMN